MTHEHECRECGEGFECEGPERAGACVEFHGVCPTCERAEVQA